MITVHIEDKEYFLPECKEELSLKKYIALADIKEPNKTIHNALVIACLLECDENYILDCDMEQFKDMCDKIGFLKDIVTDIEEIKEFEIEGIKYKVKDDFSKMKVREVSDIELLSEDKERMESLPFIIAPLVSEVEAPYKNAIEKAELILNHLTAVQALGIVLFFSLGVMEHMSDLSSSLTHQESQVTPETSENQQEKSG
jgi:hypothetical protein